MRHIEEIQVSSKWCVWLVPIKKMDESTWNRNVDNNTWNSFVRNAPQSLLLLEDFICQKHPMTVYLLREVDTDKEYIPGGYTCVFQTCDVGI